MKIYPVEGADWKLDSGESVFPNLAKQPSYDQIVDIIEGWGEEDEDRRALEMWAWERLTFKEIANEFGLADRPSAHYRVRRALNRLRKEITNEVS